MLANGGALPVSHSPVLEQTTLVLVAYLVGDALPTCSLMEGCTCPSPLLAVYHLVPLAGLLGCVRPLI